MAELAAGPHATTDPDVKGRRQDRLQRAEAAFDPLPFDGDAARAYGRIFAALMAAGRKARGARAVDLLIAATACGVRRRSIPPRIVSGVEHPPRRHRGSCTLRPPRGSERPAPVGDQGSIGRGRPSKPRTQ